MPSQLNSIFTGARAVLLDVDGTLYASALLRASMTAGFVQSCCAGPQEALSHFFIIHRFRKERERLRFERDGNACLLQAQFEVVQRRYGIPLPKVRAVVDQWIMQKPLRYLPACRRSRLKEFLENCRKRGIHLGVYSDYPTRAKVEALGLAHLIDLHLCSTDAQIDAFKPSPKGILHACSTWGLEPPSVLYVGDRADIDGEAAQAAGARFVLMGSKHSGQFAGVRDFRELDHLLNRSE